MIPLAKSGRRTQDNLLGSPPSLPSYSLLSAVRLFHTVAECEVTQPGQWAITAFPQPMHHSKGGSLETGRIVSFPEEQNQKI